MRRILLTGLAVLAILVLAASALGEMHYRSCVHAAEARTIAGDDRGGWGGNDGSERKAAVEGCSRLP